MLQQNTYSIPNSTLTLLLYFTLRCTVAYLMKIHIDTGYTSFGTAQLVPFLTIFLLIKPGVRSRATMFDGDDEPEPSDLL